MFRKRTDEFGNPIGGSKFLDSLIEWLLSIVFAVLLFFLLRNFVFRVAQVEGSSMEPTLVHGDMVLLNRFNYIFSSPQVGDIIAFPPYENDPTRYYIKRIVAKPGDVIDLVGYSFYINGEPMDDDFSYEPLRSFGDLEFPFEVKEGQFFVLGDNRNGSMDSRFSSVGTVSSDVMVGKVSVRIWPRGRIGQVD